MKIIVYLTDKVAVEFDESELTITPSQIQKAKAILKEEIKSRI